MPSGWMKNLAQLDSDYVSKLIGKKQALGSSSRKTEKKRKGDNTHQRDKNNNKHKDRNNRYPTCEPKFHKRMNKKKFLMKYLHNFKACAMSI